MPKHFLRKLFVCYACVSLAFVSITVRAKYTPEKLPEKGQGPVNPGQGQAQSAPSPTIPPGFARIADLRPTFYWIALEQDTAEPRIRELRGPNGELLVTVTERFRRDLLMEGTGRLLDGRLINYWGAVQTPTGREVRYRWCGPDAPYGYGYEGRKLVAFRSVAVDPRVIPMDTDVFIPAAVGAVLPDGSVHDGHFQAVDIGSAIQDHRIDVFTSFGDQSHIFMRHGMTNMRATAVYVRSLTKK